MTAAVIQYEFEQEFENIRLIGKGAFGAAFLVRRLSDSKMCVIKMVDISDADDNQRRNVSSCCTVVMPGHRRSQADACCVTSVHCSLL